MLTSLAHSSTYSLNITSLPDTSFQTPASTYFKVKQGNTHTLDIYEMTGWDEAI